MRRSGVDVYQSQNQRNQRVVGVGYCVNTLFMCVYNPKALKREVTVQHRQYGSVNISHPFFTVVYWSSAWVLTTLKSMHASQRTIPVRDSRPMRSSLAPSARRPLCPLPSSSATDFPLLGTMKSSEQMLVGPVNGPCMMPVLDYMFERIVTSPVLRPTICLLIMTILKACMRQG